jgi:hypothetical protein
MTDTTLQIVVSDGDVEATIKAIESALPEGATILPPAVETQSLGDAFQAAVGAAGDLPGLVGAWWLAARDADGIDPALSLVILALVFAVAYIIEWGARALLKRGDPAAPVEAKFVPRLRAAARWGVGRV